MLWLRFRNWLERFINPHHRKFPLHHEWFDGRVIAQHAIDRESAGLLMLRQRDDAVRITRKNAAAADAIY